MIPAVLAPVAALAARLGPALARLETRHWVAITGSAALHLGVLLGFNQAPPPLPPPLTFEVKLEPPPEAKPPKQRRVEAKPKPNKAKDKKHLAKKKPVKPKAREPHTLQAEWKSETRPAKDTPAVTLPDARALGVNLASDIGRAAPAKLATASNQPGAASPTAAARASAASALSEPGGKSGAGQGASSGSEPGLTLVAAQGLGKTQALAANVGAGAQGSDALAGSIAASGNLAAAALATSGGAGTSLNRASGGGSQNAQGSDFSSASPGALASGEPTGVRLTMAGVLSSMAALPSGGGSLAGGQLDGAAGVSSASAGQGSQVSLATAAGTGAAGTGAAAVVAGAGPTQGGGGGETRAASAQGEAASGVAAGNSLASAAPAEVVPTRKSGGGEGAAGEGGNTTGGGMAGAVTAPRAERTALARVGAGDSAGKAPTPRKTLPGSGEAASKTAAAESGTARGGDKLARSTVATAPAAAGNSLSPGRGGAAGTPGQDALANAGEAPGSSNDTRASASAGQVGGAGKLATSLSLGAASPSQSGAGSGFAGTGMAPTALSPGEPGSAPGLAVAMPTVPVVLEMRGGGARSNFRGDTGESGGGGSQRAPTPALARTEAGAGESLPGRGGDSPGIASAPRQGSAGGGGNNPAGGGTLQGVRVAAVQQMRADSHVQPLDVLAPSTYCPLPGLTQPDNRPRDTTQLAREQPAYANENPSFSFPIRAWAYGHQGRAVVRVQVLADGTPGQIWLKQSSGSGILDVDAREQLAKYRFKPARKNGQPVAAWIDVPVDYRLNADK